MFNHSRRARRVTIAATVTLGVTTGLLMAGVGQADEPLEEGSAHMEDFAWASQPQWNFVKDDNCWPEKAFDREGNPKQGKKCITAEDGGEAGLAFPTYYTAKKCNAGTEDEEVRVSYTIYQGIEREGLSAQSHDFEHIDVVWTRNGDNWTRSELLTSEDGEHDSKPWGEAESWNANGDEAGLGKEFPRIWIKPAYHGMSNSEEGDGKGHDFPVPASKNYHGDDKDDEVKGTGLVEVEPGGALYNKFKDNADAFGDETINPAVVADELCEHSA
ncbi:hypothetical protein ACTWQF_13685 [Streptomyces sp. 8N114]|uniref:hypothetical protein n=1 Tax=Streptomyces sp. 8N114 TaxID=3457419 RepID=UPI003FD04757